MRTIALALIRLYRKFVSPALPPACRFTPTCSMYTYEAIERYGFLRGSWMGAKRIARCNPWNPGGYDPVPDLDHRRRHTHEVKERP
ncbi:MAG: membrane protein insertion efficiency factor YidD [Anaerolineae bacterium]|nr:membrane protein insertion efficiency factor YidD [Anaerolineae bacterium]